jgi:hypothetical protein
LTSPALDTEKPLSSFSDSPLITKPPVPATMADNNTAINLSAISAGTGGFVINGESTYDYSGRAVSSAGDVNGDGLDDLIVGAYSVDPSNKSNAGKSYVIFGKQDNAAINLSGVILFAEDNIRFTCV